MEAGQVSKGTFFHSQFACPSLWSRAAAGIPTIGLVLLARGHLFTHSAKVSIFSRNKVFGTQIWTFLGACPAIHGSIGPIKTTAAGPNRGTPRMAEINCGENP